MFYGLFQSLGPWPHDGLLLRALLAALTAALLGLVAAPKLIRRLKARKVTDPSKGYTGLNPASKQGVPILGGLIILAALYLSALLWCDLTNRMVQVALVWGLGYAALGFLDDWSKIRPDQRGLGLNQPQKYAVQFLLALLLGVLFLSQAYLPVERAVAGSLYLPFTSIWRWNLSWGYLAVIVFFLIYAANAVNITDGMDGLATFPAMLLAAVLGLAAFILHSPATASSFRFEPVPGSGECVVLLAALLGACGAFLWYNAYPATIFMGDTGSIALGGILGTVAVLLKQEILFLIVGGVFLIETASSFLQTYVGVGLLGRRLFFRAPLHDHWLYQGLSESKVTLRLWLLSLLFAILGLAALELRL
ncbi:MAG: phospho-N-acetylmuramoyl-pentapeptide-transferase [Planctomycetes bacterium]|nr:phospho-N-acetylmuramoyl-pentapeptide-transferase [Planctomycetota bacterium]